MQPQKRTREVSTGIFVLVPNDPALYTYRGIPAHYSSLAGLARFLVPQANARLWYLLSRVSACRIAHHYRNGFNERHVSITQPGVLEPR
jgi:hypothetical protein